MNYVLILNNFLSGNDNFTIFRQKMNAYLNECSLKELNEFKDYMLDEPFSIYNTDMVMLAYIYLWFYPQRFNQSFEIEGADNMYQSFLKAISDEYITEDTKREILAQNFNYEILKINDLYLFVNVTDTTLHVELPDEIKDVELFCVNCNDELEPAKTLELYPNGFCFLVK